MANSTGNKKGVARRQPDSTGIAEIDELADLKVCTITDYVRAVSLYVRRCSALEAGPKKAAQIRLSYGLGRALDHDLRNACAQIRHLDVGEKKVAGALRTVNADVSENHPLDGLRLAVELKPVNLAVGRAIWNRFGDLRTFAVNIHLKFPFAVIGGVLVVPTYEELGAAADEAAEMEAEESESADETDAENDSQVRAANEQGNEPSDSPPVRRKPTTHLIERAVQRLVRAGGRKTEGDAPHLLEAIAVVAYNPDTGIIDPALPAPGSGLRWEEFVSSLAAAYRGRFEA